VNGFGIEARYQEGNEVVMFLFGAKGIPQINQPRTMGSYVQPKPRSYTAQSQAKAKVQANRDWISALRKEEQHIDNAGALCSGLDWTKMVHIASDGGARPNPGSAGWGYSKAKQGIHNAVEVL
jgi:hypothetical protein